MQQSLFAIAQPEATTSSNQLHDEVLNQPLKTAVFVVLDLETTGLTPKKNAITELTAIKYQNGQDMGMLSTLVYPTEPIPANLTEITGITNDMVKEAPSVLTVLTDFMAFVGPNPIIVGHNVAFDWGFLTEKLAQNGMGSMADKLQLSQALCTRMLALKAIPGLPNYQGVTVATACGIHNPNPHRAEADVRMSAGILFSLIERLTSKGTLAANATVEDLLAYQGELKTR
jgi:DNA polymerase III epsilon subunit family exonuclease